MIVRGVDCVRAIGSTSLVSSRGSQLGSDIPVRSSNYDGEATTRLPSIDGVIAADRSPPVYTLDHSDGGRIVAVRGVGIDWMQSSV